MYDLLVASIPFTYTFGPSLGPALLKACCEKEDISTFAWDLSADFNHRYENKEDYKNIISWMQSPELQLSKDEYDFYQSIIKYYVDRIIKDFNPKIIALSLLTINSQKFTEDLCYQLKLLNPKLKIILGGGGVNLNLYQYNKNWYELMLESTLADTILIGEGEYALPRIIKSNLIGIVTEPLLNNDQFENVPFPNYDDYDFSYYTSHNSFWDRRSNTYNDTVAMVTASKGCVKSCNFCDVAKIWPKFRFRSGQRVADEIKYLYNKYGIKFFNFSDSLINGGMKTFQAMNEALANDLPNTINYQAQFIFRGPRDMPEKHFELMARAGCSLVNVGLESGSERVREHMGKGSSSEDVNYSTEMLIKYNIRQTWNIITGYPTETDEDWQETINLIKYWMPKSNGLLSVTPINTFLLLDKTPITDTDLYYQLQLEQEIVNGYSSFAWKSKLYPDNTYQVRAERFFEVCNLLISYNPEEEINLRNKIQTVKKQLDWYNENKVK
jgi:radical SAM superfamily enzyme YgiQ (UPF0313 family)